MCGIFERLAREVKSSASRPSLKVLLSPSSDHALKSKIVVQWLTNTTSVTCVCVVHSILNHLSLIVVDTVAIALGLVYLLSG
jgi:hypothetical protein